MDHLLNTLQPSAQERIHAALQVEQTLASYGDSCDPKGCGHNQQNRRMIAYDQSGDVF